MSLIRGVLLAGQFRTQHQVNTMSPNDQRNTLIVELSGRTNQPVGHFQAMDDATLAGTGAVLVFIRRAGIRTDAQLKTISDDDQRNILIVEIGAQTGLGRELQGLSNMDLVLQGLGKGQPGISLIQPSYIRGVLLAGQFRTQHQLNTMSADDQRNTLIVELAGRTNQPASHFQAMNDATLAGTGAALVLLSGAGIRTDAQLKTISDDDQRNILIVEIGAQTNLGSKLQELSSMDLVLTALGVDPIFPVTLGRAAGQLVLGSAPLPDQLDWDWNPIEFGTGVAVGGHAHLTVRKDGTYTFSGQFYDSGAFEYNMSLVWGVVAIGPPANTVFMFPHNGHVSGSFESGSSYDDWQTDGTYSDMEKRWAQIVATNYGTAKADAKGDFTNLINSIISDVGTVLGVVGLRVATS